MAESPPMPSRVSSGHAAPEPSSPCSVNPPHRSHSPSNNLKRSSPFQFGSRYLLPTDDPYEFNAWDHVDSSLDPDYVAHTLKQLSFQRDHPVSDFDRKRFNEQPEKWWDRFYGNNKERFFKDRKWLRQEFPVLAKATGTIGEVLESVTSTGRDDTAAVGKPELDVGDEDETKVLDREGQDAWQRQVQDIDDGPWDTILEVGAGAGNTAFPLLKLNKNPDLMIHACDFSKKAVNVMRENAEYDLSHMRAEVWDIAAEALPPGVEEGSIDVVVLIFIFSALSPPQWAQALKNVWRVLRPGGEVCFRDYGRGDLAQVRFKKGRMMGENFYIRGDGTRVYFFAEDELREMWRGDLQSCFDTVSGTSIDVDEAVREDSSGESEERAPTFEVVTLGRDQRMLVNRSKQLKMYRCWMQGRFRKPITPVT